MSIRTLIADVLGGRVKAWRANHNPVAHQMFDRVNELPDPLRTINQALLYASVETLKWWFGAEAYPRNGRPDSRTLTADQYRRSYAILLAYYVYIFTSAGRTDDIAAGSRKLVGWITESPETVDAISDELESVPPDGGRPDALRLSMRALASLRGVLGDDGDLEESLSFSLYLNEMFAAASGAIKETMPSQES